LFASNENAAERCGSGTAAEDQMTLNMESTLEKPDGQRLLPASACSAKTLVYLATPYSHPDASVREGRFRAVNAAAAELMRKGMHIYSPISHTHPIALAGDLPLGWEYWQAYDRAILAACCAMIVLTLDGWKESKGVAGEIAIANEMGLPVQFISPNADLRQDADSAASNVK
jgi:hypothetical protein